VFLEQAAFSSAEHVFAEPSALFEQHPLSPSAFLEQQEALISPEEATLSPSAFEEQQEAFFSPEQATFSPSAFFAQHDCCVFVLSVEEATVAVSSFAGGAGILASVFTPFLTLTGASD
tara:strand:- start:58 stop:411 length:354 start_codon:yes stop_codon:yes gene_type:complete